MRVISPRNKNVHPNRRHYSLLHSLLAIALFQCWYWVVMVTIWATCITLITDKVYDLSIQPTLLTAFGTVIGALISYRTAVAYERYNESRKLWANITVAIRTLSRTIWFHVSDSPPENSEASSEASTRILTEKRKIMDLVMAFGIAVKYYLRGEEGIEHEDFRGLVKNCPLKSANSPSPPKKSPLGIHRSGMNSTDTCVPGQDQGDVRISIENASPDEKVKPGQSGVHGDQSLRDQSENCATGPTVPLQITFYLSSWISGLPRRKLIDGPITSTMITSLNQLVDSFSGLERIFTTEVPFCYGAHLWTSCLLYLTFLPFQLWKTLGYAAIPATAVVGSIFFGFLAASEEIENPFGKSKNDLKMDQFCRDIQVELAALTSLPTPMADEWIFSDDNDYTPPQGTESMQPLRGE
ncbi:unnamed protein product [Rhizoctonia solani]|uniref:Uncharacterized protein n=1 Tax=Rhizoctonia solani TaxID=456999 RepID=A0A8H2WZS0_9AGAM|nr:unnamed protein product [Rhizoctonia solani]